MVNSTMIGIRQFGRFITIFPILLASGNACCDDRIRVVFKSELLPEIGVLAANPVQEHYARSGSNVRGNLSERRQLVDRLGLEFNGQNRIGVLHYRDVDDHARYGIGFRYGNGKKFVDALFTRAGFLITTEYRKLHVNIGYRYRQADDNGFDPTLNLMLSKSW